MKRIVFICLLTICFIMTIGQKSYAIEDSTSESYTSSSNAESKATIGFSSKHIQKDDGHVQISQSSSKPSTTGKLPSTGESIGVGSIILGLIFIIIFFIKGFQNMIKNKNNKYKERI